MARRPQRSRTWSLRQVTLDAGVSRKTATAAVAAGHLNTASLGPVDVLVLRVVAMLSSLQPVGELRPANSPRETPQRDVDAVALVRGHSLALGAHATLIVTAAGAQLARSLSEVSAATLDAAQAGQPYLALPVGQWALEIANQSAQEAA